jgi:predicted DNA-binding transcriptional regulator YafY
LRIATAGPVGGMEEAALRSLAKLEQLLPTRIRKRVSSLYESVVSVPSAAPRVDAELLTLMAAASRDQQQLQFSYGDRQKRATTRQVEPHGVAHVGSRWYLVAYDLDRADFRTFRIDRVTSRPRAGKRFTPRAIPHGDLATYVSRSISVDMYAKPAQIIFHAPLATVAPHIPSTAGKLIELGPERCRLDTGATDWRYLALHVALCGFDFEVTEPDELIEEIGALGKRLRRAYRASKQ